MSCSCEWDSPAAYRKVDRKAAKPHTCCECRGPIKVGDTYTYTSGIWEGMPDSFHTCERCDALQQALVASGFCISHGGLEYDYAEYLELLDVRKPQFTAWQRMKKWYAGVTQ